MKEQWSKGDVSRISAQLDYGRAKRYVRMADEFRRREVALEVFLTLVGLAIAILGVWCSSSPNATGLEPFVGVGVGLWFANEAWFTDTPVKKSQRMYRRQLRRAEQDIRRTKP